MRSHSKYGTSYVHFADARMFHISQRNPQNNTATESTITGVHRPRLADTSKLLRPASPFNGSMSRKPLIQTKGNIWRGNNSTAANINAPMTEIARRRNGVSVKVRQ